MRHRRRLQGRRGLVLLLKWIPIPGHDGNTLINWRSAKSFYQIGGVGPRLARKWSLQFAREPFQDVFPAFIVGIQARVFRDDSARLGQIFLK